MYRLNNKRKGVAAMYTVLVVGAAALIVSVGIAFIGLGELEMGYTLSQGGGAMSVTDGCIEETMRRMRLDNNYGVGAGSIALSVSEGSCIITVSDLGGGQRRIIATGTIGEYNKKAQTDLTISSNVITIDSWGEQTD